MYYELKREITSGRRKGRLIKKEHRLVDSAPRSAGQQSNRLIANSLTRLLSLPGEIRNMIYKYALYNFYDAEKFYGWKHVPYWTVQQLAEYNASDHAMVLHWDPTLFYYDIGYEKLPVIQEYVQFKKDYFALGHTCMQLRAESRSLDAWMYSHVLVHVDNLEQYLEYSYPSRDPSIASGYRGKIVVLTAWGASPKFDILPLMKLLHSAPKLRCDLTARWMQVDDNDKEIRLLFGKQRSLLAKVMSHGSCAADRIMLHIEDTKYPTRWHLEIWFKPALRPEWMTNKLTSSKQNKRRQSAAKTAMKASLIRLPKKEEWLMDAGWTLDDLADWDVVMGIAHP